MNFSPNVLDSKEPNILDSKKPPQTEEALLKLLESLPISEHLRNKILSIFRIHREHEEKKKFHMMVALGKTRKELIEFIQLLGIPVILETEYPDLPCYAVQTKIWIHSN
ncbi:MAG: hypothetical protein EBQ92_00855 [Proteobacteria bacterium]|nr:hypothetical protein [Pseudomonadota bacterium]